MKKAMLFMLGLSLFAVSCKKQETQNDNTTMTDSVNTSGTMSGTSGAMSSDSTGTAGDSTMNQGNTQNNQRSTTTNQTNGSTGGTQSNGTRMDSAR